MAALELSDTLKTILLSLQKYVFLVSALFLSERWKEKWLENKSISLFPDKNLLLKELKESKIPFNLLLTSTIEPLIFSLYLEINFSINR